MVATALVIASVCPLRAEENLVAYKSLAPELAFDLARAALNSCRSRGFQVAVAVVDRFGVTQVMLPDRFAGPHMPPTAAGKAWTAASFRTSTTELNAISQPGMLQAGIRHLPGVVIIGGGLVVEATGSLVAAVGVSGAPGATLTKRARGTASTPSATGWSSDLDMELLQYPRLGPDPIASEASPAATLEVRAICELAHFRLKEIVP